MGVCKARYSFFLRQISTLILSTWASTSFAKGYVPPVNKTQIQLELPSNQPVYLLSAELFRIAISAPAGSVIALPHNSRPVIHDYIDENGERRRSSTGFYRIEILETPNSAIPPEELSKWNARGIYLASSVVNEALSKDAIAPLPTEKPNDDYLKLFESSGKPRFNFTEKFQARFGSQLNRIIRPDEISSRDKIKWAAIMAELLRVGDRKKETPAQLLFISQPLASRYSEDFERTGRIQHFGAWSIAVTGTARRHGFEHVPCAEFMSEILRQAYTRAAYDVREDFNNDKGNSLIWSSTAAVVNLTNAMHKAGWIPWEAYRFKPQTGAIAMHYLANSPGHAYMYAGENGQPIVDNGSPRGRDLRTSEFKTINLMYQHGIFFLPPGVNPQRW